tara:strand:- start:338 stop:517 length:180 start_codon:yes stop_codon:yes gene_type:complete
MMMPQNMVDSVAFYSVIIIFCVVILNLLYESLISVWWGNHQDRKALKEKVTPNCCREEE